MKSCLSSRDTYEDKLPPPPPHQTVNKLNITQKSFFLTLFLFNFSSRSHSHEFKWHHVVETTYDDDTIDQQRCTKLSYSSVSDDSDNNELVLAKKNKRWSSRKKKISRNSKIKLFMMTSSSSSADESGINFTNEKANWDYHDDVDSNHEDEDEEDETQTIVSSSCKTCVDFSDDFTQELEPIYENAMTRSPKKIATKKRRVKNTRGMIMSKNGNIYNCVMIY